jgi:hypothetical protein
MNPGITKTVALLNAHGFDTCDSGDGETHDYSCDRERGYVVVRLRSDQPLEASADSVAALLKAHGAPVGEPVSDSGGVIIQANYCPHDGIRLIDVEGIHDRMLTTPPA